MKNTKLVSQKQVEMIIRIIGKNGSEVIMGYTKYGTLSKIRLIRATYIIASIRKDVTGTNRKILWYIVMLKQLFIKYIKDL